MNKNKETTLLMVLLSILILYVFYSFLLKPKIATNDELREEIETEETLVKSMYAVAAGYSTNVKKLGEHKDTLQKQSNLFYSLEDRQENFINLLHEYLNEDNLRLVSISSSDHASSLGNEFPGLESPYNVYSSEDSSKGFSANMLEGDSKYPRVDKMEIIFDYTGTYEEVQNFFDALKDTDKFTVCNVLDVSISYENPEEDEEAENNNGQNTGQVRDQDEEEETESPQSQISFTVLFPRLFNLTALNVEPEKLDAQEVEMPKNLADGSYRKMYTPENFVRAVKGIFSSD